MAGQNDPNGSFWGEMAKMIKKARFLEHRPRFFCISGPLGLIGVPRSSAGSNMAETLRYERILMPRPNHRCARQGRWHPLDCELLHLLTAPRQHRRRAARRRCARRAGNTVSTRQAHGGPGRGHGDGGLRQHERHHEHRNRGSTSKLRSSHAKVADTARRPSSQGPASALRFDYCSGYT